MPRILNNILFPQETQKESQCQLLHLISLGNIRGYIDGVLQTEPDMFLVDSNYDVIYDSQEYTRFPLKFSGVNVSTDGTIDKASITLSNVSRELMDLIEKYDGLSGCTVGVTTVYEKFLDEVYTYAEDGTLSMVTNPLKDSTAHIRDEYSVDSYVLSESTISFQLNAIIDFDIRVPRRRFTPFSCYWRFRQAETCGYPTTAIPTTDIPVPDLTLTECKKSLEDCQNHCNSTRFGGFPGIPSNIRRLFL